MSVQTLEVVVEKATTLSKIANVAKSPAGMVVAGVSTLALLTYGGLHLKARLDKKKQEQQMKHLSEMMESLSESLNNIGE